MIIEIADNFSDFQERFGHYWGPAFNGNPLFGTAFLQGGRLQFTTALQVNKYVKLVGHVNRADAQASLDEVLEKSNRPTDNTHKKQIRTYLEQTAGKGIKFILPASTLNFGVDIEEPETTKVTLILLHGNIAGLVTWPALLLLGAGVRLDCTDGAHRWEVWQELEQVPGNMAWIGEHSCDIKIVFESDRTQTYQDFADCGKAKPIQKSLVTSFDIRNRVNQRTKELVQAVPFLKEHVDATASGLNLSGGSRRIWSMNAVRMFVNTAVNDGPIRRKIPDAEFDLLVQMRTDGLEAFMAAMVAGLGDFVALSTPGSGVTPGKLRNERGGSFLMRAVGMALLAQAFKYCRHNEIAFDDMAATLDGLDWYLLNGPDAEPVLRDATNPKPYVEWFMKNRNPVWIDFIRMSERAYSIHISVEDVERAWTRIEEKLGLPPTPEAEPAEKAAE